MPTLEDHGTNSEVFICKNRECGIVFSYEKAVKEIKEFVSKDGKHGSHLKVSCPCCNSFYKFAPQHEPKFHFGKYKDKTLKEVAQFDPSYLKWLIREPRQLSSGFIRNLHNALEYAERSKNHAEEQPLQPGLPFIVSLPRMRR